MLNCGGAFRLQQALQKQGIFMSLDECKQMIQVVKGRMPKLSRFQQELSLIATPPEGLEFTFPHDPNTKYGVLRNHLGFRGYMPLTPNKYRDNKLQASISSTASFTWMS